MGCHTWFSKPLTDEEFGWMREYALKDAITLFGDTDENRELGCVDLYSLELVKNSLLNDSSCYYGRTWYEAGFGSENPKFIDRYGSKPFIHCVKGYKGRKKLFIDVAFDVDIMHKLYPGMTYKEFTDSKISENIYFPYFHDEFRIYNYPDKVIHNKKELRAYLGKAYFKLTQYQLDRISMFFKMYPGGVITFG